MKNFTNLLMIFQISLFEKACESEIEVCNLNWVFNKAMEGHTWSEEGCIWP